MIIAKASVGKSRWTRIEEYLGLPDLYLNNPVVKACLDNYLAGNATFEGALAQCVYVLAKQTDALTAELLKAKQEEEPVCVLCRTHAKEIQL